METYLLRHGETQYNVEGLVQGWSDSPLTENGRNYAQGIAREISHVQNPLIVSSDLGRAVSTAQIIRETLGLKDDILTDPNLRERFCGDYEGKHINELFDYVEKHGFQRTPEGIYLADLGGLEAIQDVRNRTAKVQTMQDNRPLILVGHMLINNYLRENKNPTSFKFDSGRGVVRL